MNGMHSLARLTPAIGLLVLVAGCDATTFDALDSDVVVELLLVADEPLPPLYLSRTAGLNEIFDFDEKAVRDANVLLTAPNNETIAFTRHEAAPGVYWPGVSEHLAVPGGTYQLTVTIPGEANPITASTTVPNRFEILSASDSRVVYQAEEQLELTITPGAASSSALNYYVFVTEALDVREEHLVPLAADIYNASDGELDLDDFRMNGSPLLSENNLIFNPDGTVTIRYPWIAISFFGRNILRLNSVDQNFYDFIRSQSIQQDGSTFAPGEIPNPIERVGGAHGVFGSVYQVQYHLTVLR